MKEYKINEYLSLRLESLIPEDNIIGSVISFLSKKVLNFQNKTTYIYVKGKRFDQCKFLLMDIPVEEMDLYDDIDSIDEAAETLDHSLEIFGALAGIDSDTEFWAHCSNLEAWAENDYDTRLLHRNLSFPLLRKLTEAGDPRAKRVFKNEIIKRISSQHHSVIMYLVNEGYLNFLSPEEFETVFSILEESQIDYVHIGTHQLVIFDGESLDLQERGIRNIMHIRNLKKYRKSLKKLNLSHNHLRQISGLDDFSALKDLNLSFNNIKEISGLGDLSNLRHLSLAGNNITKVKGLENLTRLKSLNLLFNPLVFKELRLMFLPAQKVVSYCRETL